MHRPFAFSFAIATIACAWTNQALAQNPAAYDNSYDQYNDPDAPYDDYDAEQPYDDEQYGESLEQPVDPAVGSIDNFHSELAPYGSWIQSTEFGLIRVPSRSVVGTSFMPYATGGSWQYTNVGWMFASDWRWGWATFHYGRWYRDTGHGWCWIPGSVWAPAWVDWRYGGGVVGWAPLPPRHHRTVWVFASARHMNRRQSIATSIATRPGTTGRRHRSGTGSAPVAPTGIRGRDAHQIERAAKIRIRPIRSAAAAGRCGGERARGGGPSAPLARGGAARSCDHPLAAGSAPGETGGARRQRARAREAARRAVSARDAASCAGNATDSAGRASTADSTAQAARPQRAPAQARPSA